MSRIALFLTVCILGACARESSRDEQPAQADISTSVPEDARELLEGMNDVERRPLRAKSARMLDGAIAGARQAITSRDATGFEVAFTNLTAVCNTCHQAERASSIRVEPPRVRTSVTVGPPGQGL